MSEETVQTLEVVGDAEPVSEVEGRMAPVWGSEVLRVRYVGPFLYPTGYGMAARSHAKALKAVGAGVMAQLNHIPHPGLAAELVRDDHDVNEMLDRRFWPEEEGQRRPDAEVWHVTPDSWARTPDVPSAGYCVWETIGLPSGWAEACGRMDAVLTCSEFSAGLFRDGGVSVPVMVAPHPIDTGRFCPGDEPDMRGNLGEGIQTVFLVVSQWMFRKGVEDAVLAYASEFSRGEPVALLLAAWRWSHAVSEKDFVRGYIGFLLDGLNKADLPGVWFVGDNLPDMAMPRLYRVADVLVSPSKAEALCLPVFEAAACGRPAICTGWGGMWDFLDAGSAYPVAYTMETVNGAGPKWSHYDSSQKWARPSLDDLRRAMREAHEDVIGRKRRGMAARRVVEERLSVPVAGTVMLDAIRRVAGK